MIHTDGLVRRFKDLEAVAGVSFDVGAGEVFGFLGPNGAGKTTTISMLCTLLRPTAGAATIAGYDIVSQAPQVRRSIGLVFQDTTLDEDLTAVQNLRFHAQAYGVARDVYQERSASLLELVQLTDRRDSRVRTFSGGMKRRLEIARGLLHHPKVLFLDEPTLGLDPQTRRKIWEHIFQLREREGLTIFLTTHYMDEAEHCDRIAIIDHGKIARLDTPKALKDGVGGDRVSIRVDDPVVASGELRSRYGLETTLDDGVLSFTVAHGDQFLPEFVRTFALPLQSIEVRRPTLDDVFLSLTGHDIRDEGASERDQLRNRAGVLM